MFRWFIAANLSRCLLVFLLLLICSTSSRASFTITFPTYNYASGTNVPVGGRVDPSADETALITSVQLFVNGTTVNTHTYSPGVPYDSIGATIDSTHFQDGSSITVVIIALDSNGGAWVNSSSGPVYNKAFVYGNQIPDQGVGTLYQGFAAVGVVNPAFKGVNYTVTPNDSVGGVLQYKQNILNAIAPSTAFYCWSHGRPDSLGDSSAGPLYNPATWLTNVEITQQRMAKTASQPGYSFVFADGCRTAVTSQLSDAFATNGTDKVFLGWPSPIADSSHDVSWTGKMFQYLTQGYQLGDAMLSADMSVGRATDSNGNEFDPTPLGDIGFKLAGIYGKVRSLDWYKPN